jgi:drug/metabolite transporter (DMT)-like permease
MKETKPSLLLLFIILLFIVICEAIAQCCIKKCKLTKKIEFYILGVFFYSMVCLGLYKMYSFQPMGLVNLLWSCMSIIIVILLGMTIFHEKITIYDFIGIILIFIGLFFVFIKDHHK